ncbi:ribonuclease H-like domain-containing protein [Escherichia coli]|uniref:ribonuclease H-like domain-containing protein n=1 Tax=Escherichia coli TaxID=562 RepID=UPI00307A5953
MSRPKILTIDIETAPIKAHVWGLFDQNVGLNQIDTEWSILSFCAKWLHSDEVIYMDTFDQKNKRNDRKLVRAIHKLLNEADIVNGQNVQRFDRRKINARFILNNLPPPSPYRVVDTMLMARRTFGFTSNKLEWLSDKLCTRYKKLKHKLFPGFELWSAFLNGDPAARTEMREYNIVDVLSTEELYLKLRPWTPGHPNINLYNEDDGHLHCTHCGSTNLAKKGFRFTQVGKYQRYHCGDCGAWPHGRKMLNSKEARENVLGSNG